MLRSNTKWWIVAGILAVVHFSSLTALMYYVLDNYYDQVSPFDPLVIALMFPIVLLFPLFDEYSLATLPLNSILWGCVLAEPLRWWCGWPAWRFSVRTLIIVMTLVAILLGLAAWAPGRGFFCG